MLRQSFSITVKHANQMHKGKLLCASMYVSMDILTWTWTRRLRLFKYLLKEFLNIHFDSLGKEQRKLCPSHDLTCTTFMTCLKSEIPNFSLNEIILQKLQQATRNNSWSTKQLNYRGHFLIVICLQYNMHRNKTIRAGQRLKFLIISGVAQRRPLLR